MPKRGKAKPTPEQIRKRNLKARYGITPEFYTDLLKIQRGGCAICLEKTSRNKSGTFLFTDHCHDKKHVRGLLCHHCNIGLGAFGDNIRLLKKAIKYLQKGLPLQKGLAKLYKRHK